MRPLRASEGYRLWAPTYSDETAISFLENGLVEAMTPPLEDLRLLDAGCGTGRRLTDAHAASATGLDQSREMLAAAARIPGVEFVRGDVRAMQFAAKSFDVIWCRLVLGHLPSIESAYAEFARVADDGATLIISDFHPAAWDAGHRRTFRLGDNRIELEHHVHRFEDHVRAADAADLDFLQAREAEVGPAVRSFYESTGRLECYFRDRGLPVVLALAFRKAR